VFGVGGPLGGFRAGIEIGKSTGFALWRVIAVALRSQRELP
jgi:hypothetical protein